MTNEELLKTFKEIDAEDIATKVSALMFIQVSHNKEGIDPEAFIHVMNNFTPEEMAFIVCVYGYKQIEFVYQTMPGLQTMAEMAARFSKEAKEEE